MRWYFGGGWGYWSVKGNWTDDVGTPFETHGAFRTARSSFSLQTGYKWHFRSIGMFIDPRLQVGELFGSDSQASPSSAFAAVRVSIGMNW